MKRKKCSCGDYTSNPDGICDLCTADEIERHKDVLERKVWVWEMKRNGKKNSENN